MLVKLENGLPVEWPVSEMAFDLRHPNVSFVKPIDRETLAQFGYGVYNLSDPEAYDAQWQEAQEASPVLLDDVWMQNWTIVDKYTSEVRSAKQAEIDASEEAAAAEMAATEYKRLRELAYPTINEQMDMQYWDTVNNTTNWKDAITKVKTDYPKT